MIEGCRGADLSSRGHFGGWISYAGPPGMKLMLSFDYSSTGRWALDGVANNELLQAHNAERKSEVVLPRNSLHTTAFPLGFPGPKRYPDERNRLP